MGSPPKVIQHAIVTYARSWSALAVVRSLGERGVRVYAGDTVPLGAATFSKYTEASFIYPEPGKERAFIAALVKKCEEIRTTHGGEILLLPIHEESYIISKHRNHFPNYVHHMLPNNKILQKIQNKGELVKIAQKHQVKIPKTRYCSATHAAKLSGLIFPVYVKKTEGSGSVGIFRAENEVDYKRILGKLSGSIVVQEFIPGRDYCCCCLFNNGEPIIVTTYTALQTYPTRGGTTVYRKNVKRRSIESEAIKLLKGVQWHGVAELDFRIDERDFTPYLIEVNPRFWGGLNQAIHSNLDFPYLVWRLAEGHTIKRIRHFKNIRTGNFIGALAATIQEVTEKDLKELKKESTIRKGNRAILHRIPFYRKYITRRYLKRRVVDDIYDPKDPGAMAGLLFPLAVYAKYGKINEKLLIDSSGKK